MYYLSQPCICKKHVHIIYIYLYIYDTCLYISIHTHTHTWLLNMDPYEQKNTLEL